MEDCISNQFCMLPEVETYSLLVYGEVECTDGTRWVVVGGEG